MRISKSAASAGCFSPPLPIISTVFRFSRMIGFRSTVQFHLLRSLISSIQQGKEEKENQLRGGTILRETKVMTRCSSVKFTH